MSEQETPVQTTGAETTEPASSDQQQGSTQEFVSKAELSALETRLVETIQASTERTKQSQRDAIKDRFEGLSDQILENLSPILEKSGVNLKEEKRKAAVDRILAGGFLENSSGEGELPKASTTQPPASGSAESPENLLIDSLLKESGLSRDHPEIAKWLANLPAGKTVGGITRDLLGLVDEIGDRKEPSGNITVPAGSPAPQTNVDKLVAGYREDALAVRGKGMAALRAVQEKWRKQGLANPEEVPLKEWVPLNERQPTIRR